MIVLNPFLDFLGHSGLKYIGLPPGTGSGCFQSSQDIVYELTSSLVPLVATKADSTGVHMVSKAFNKLYTIAKFKLTISSLKLLRSILVIFNYYMFSIKLLFYSQLYQTI